MKLMTDAMMRREVSIDCSEPQLTDQSFKNACDINVIMAQYSKTGMLPQQTTIPARYVDNTIVPTLEESFNIVRNAYNAFYELPATIRKLMDNDPSQLENFLSDANNRDLLLKHGMLVEDSSRRVGSTQTPEATSSHISDSVKSSESKTFDKKVEKGI